MFLDLTIIDILVQTSPVLQVPPERGDWARSKFSLLDTMSKLVAPLLVLLLGLGLPGFVPQTARMFAFGTAAGMQMYVTACDARGVARDEMELRWAIEGLAFALVGFAIEVISWALLVSLTTDERPAMVLSTILCIVVTAAATCQPADHGIVRRTLVATRNVLEQKRHQEDDTAWRRWRSRLTKLYFDEGAAPRLGGDFVLALPFGGPPAGARGARWYLLRRCRLPPPADDQGHAVGGLVCRGSHRARGLRLQARPGAVQEAGVAAAPGDAVLRLAVRHHLGLLARRSAAPHHHHAAR